MGYTDYFLRASELALTPFAAWVADGQCLLAALPPTVVIHPEHTPPGRRPYPLRLAGPDGTGTPRLTADLVACNGALPDAGDPFAVPRLLASTLDVRPDEQGRYFSCCKTVSLPYDLLVTAALIRLHVRFPVDVVVSSDGGPSGWEAGCLLCADVFGSAALPPEVARYSG